MVYPNIPSPAALANAAANATALPPKVEFLSTLTKHTNAVNAVKFSPDGERIGTAGDGESLSPFALEIDSRQLPEMMNSCLISSASFL